MTILKLHGMLMKNPKGKSTISDKKKTLLAPICRSRKGKPNLLQLAIENSLFFPQIPPTSKPSVP